MAPCHSSWGIAKTQTISPAVRASLARIAEEMRTRSRSLRSITSSLTLRRRRKSLPCPRIHHRFSSVHCRQTRPSHLPYGQKAETADAWKDAGRDYVLKGVEAPVRLHATPDLVH